MFNNKSEEKQRFSIRKLTIGVTSVLLGISFLTYSSQQANADEVSAKTETVAKVDNAVKTTNLEQQQNAVKSNKATDSETAVKQTGSQTVTPAAKADTTQSQAVEDSSNIKPSDITQADFDHMYQYGDMDQHQDLTDAQLQALGLKHGEYYRIINGKKYIYHVKADYQLLDENGKPSKYDFDYIPFHNADGTVSSAQDRIGAFPVLIDPNDPKFDFWFNAATTAGNAYDKIYYIPAGKGNTIYVTKRTQLSSIDARRGVVPDAAYTVSDAQWDTTPADPDHPYNANVPGTYHENVAITMPTGKTTTADATIVVVDLQGKTIYTHIGGADAPAAESSVTGAPAGSKSFTWTSQPSTDKAGDFTNAVNVTFPDGSTATANVNIHVLAPTGHDVTIKIGDPAPSAESVDPKYGQDEDVEINYDANRQSQVINYVDNSDKQTVVSHETKVGPVNSSTNFIAHAPHNWTIVPGQNIPNKINFGVNEAAPIVIYVEHATSDVSDSKDITRIVSYQDPLSGKKLTLTTQTTTLSRTGKKDVITGQIKWGEWSTSSLQAVTAPTLRGYHVLNPDAAAALAVNGSTASVIEAVFNYQADQFTQDINYVDVNTGSVIKHDSVIGQSNQKNVPYQGTVPDKWQLVEGQNIPTSFDFGVEQPSPVVIYIQHGVNDNKNADAHTATRRIYKIDPVTNTKTLIATQVASVHREVVTYLVTGVVIYQGQWTADHTGSDIWQEVNAPELPGYCIASSYSAPEVRIDGNTADAEVGFSYAAKWHMQKVNYVAKDTGSIVNSDYLQGQTGKVQAATAKTDVDAKTDQNKGANVAAQDNQAPKANDTQDTNDVKPSNITRAEFDQMYKNSLDQHQDLTDAQLQAWGLKRDQYYRVINGKKYVFRVKADYQLLDENEKPTKYHFDYVPFHNADGTVSEAQDRIGNFPSTLDLTDPDANFWLNVSTTAGNAYDFIYYIPAGKSNTIYVNKGTQINSIDPRKGVAPDSQYTVTDAQWDVDGSEKPYNPNVPGAYHENVIITMPTSKTTSADATIVIVDLNGKTVYVTKGDPVPKPSTVITTGTDTVVPSDSNTRWTTTAPDTSTVGTKSSQVTITYPDGNTSTTTATIIVSDPKGTTISTTPGVKPDPTIQNLDQMPKGTTYTWTYPDDVDPSKLTPGNSVNTKVSVTYPDGHTTTVPTTVTVKENGWTIAGHKDVTITIDRAWVYNTSTTTYNLQRPGSTRLY